MWLNPAAVKEQRLDDTAVRTRLLTALASLQGDAAACSIAPVRLLVLDQPPSIDDGEITDKGYINQRAVLERRAAHVEQLHEDGPEVISLRATIWQQRVEAAAIAPCRDITGAAFYLTKISMISTGPAPALWKPCCVPAFM